MSLLLERRSDLGTLELAGKDRVSWLNGVVTQDVSKLGPGGGAYALAVQKNGKLLAELFVLATARSLLVGAPRAALSELAAHFDKHIVMEHVEVEDVSASKAWLVLHGAEAAEPLRALPAGAHSAAVDTTGLGGALVCTDAGALAEVERALGAPVVDQGTLRQLFVEAGVPRFGVDYDGSNYPQEAGLEGRAVSFQKGCYLGQEAVFMLQERGHVKRKLVGLRVAGAGDVERGALVLAEGAEVGSVTSAAPLPTSGPGGDERAVIAWVKYKHLERDAFEVAGRAARR